MLGDDEPSVAEQMIGDLGLEPGLTTEIDVPERKAMRQIDDEVFERELRAHPERFLQRPPLTEAELQDATRRRAYEIWEGEGRPEGEDLDIWLAAEKQIRTEERIRREYPLSAEP